METEFVPQWQPGIQVGDEFLGAGQVAEVRRRTFEYDGGTLAYAYKWMHDLDEAKRTVDVYERLKEAKLPVVSFVVPIAWKDTSGDTLVGISMEDMTAGGSRSIVNVRQKQVVTPNYTHDGVLAEASADPTALKHRMIRDLAVMHNNGLYDFHPGISFFLQFDHADKRNVSHVILDYSNICYREMPAGWPWNRGDFETECIDDAHKLLDGLAGNAKQYQSLLFLYRDTRRRGVLVSDVD